MPGRFETQERGVTLVEIIVAALVGVVIAGGTMLAFTTAKKVSVGSSGTVEAADLAQQTIEQFRNRIACDDSNADGTPRWFNAADCTVNTGPGGMDGNWTSAALPVNPGTFSLIGQTGERQYKVTPADCDGAPGNDCFQVETKVSWTPRQ